VTDQEIHKLGEVLRSAREERDVDLARVERDTKIRSRYLSALERGAYRELPGAVYTKGFLRNYGSYLGLDTDYLVDLYRLESAAAPVERPSVQTPPRPIAARRSRAFVITPSLLAGALLTVGVVAFAVYLVMELVTFAGIPDLRLTVPAGDINGYGGDEYTIVGVTEPGSTVTAETANRKTEVTADGEGNFEVTVALRPGSNVVTVTALDPQTNRFSDPERRTIVVGEPGSAAPSAGQELALDEPGDGASGRGPIELRGMGPPGATILVTARPTAAARPIFRVTTLTGQQVPVRSSSPRAPDPLRLTVADDGTFEGSLTLPPAEWRLELALQDGDAEPLVRDVTIQAPPGLSGTLRVQGGPSYLEVDEDQQPKRNVSGRVAQAGSSLRLQARQDLRIRVGNAGAVRLTINGINLGIMGSSGTVVEWRITRL
jgi:nitrogen fixation protein FixH/transcriptional regulator with XRE-family HTH domain